MGRVFYSSTRSTLAALFFCAVFTIVVLVICCCVDAYHQEDEFSLRNQLLLRHAVMVNKKASSSAQTKNPLSALPLLHQLKQYERRMNARRTHRQQATAEAKRCPVRPTWPSSSSASNSVDLPQSVINTISQHLQKTTMAACEPGPHNPSAPGFSGALIVGPKTYFLNIGCSDVSTKAAVTSDTIFRLASVSKTFTVKMVLDAFQKDGLIESLDDEVTKYVPEFFVPNPYTGDGAQPTFRAMCSQQAGLPRESPCSPTDCNITLDQAFQRLRQQRLVAKIWDRPSYSNVAFSLLGHIVAERLYRINNKTSGNGSAFSQLLDKVSARYNMSSTGCRFTPSVLQRLATAYTPLGIPMPPLPLHFDDPAGGIFSTATDLVKWLRMWLFDFASSPVYRQNQQPLYIDGSLDTGFSSPWELYDSDPEFGYIVRSKGGYIPGSTSMITMVPELSVGFVGLWNGAGFDSAAAGAFATNQILGAVIPQLHHEVNISFIRLLTFSSARRARVSAAIFAVPSRRLVGDVSSPRVLGPRRGDRFVQHDDETSSSRRARVHQRRASAVDGPGGQGARLSTARP